MRPILRAGSSEATTLGCRRRGHGIFECLESPLGAIPLLGAVPLEMLGIEPDLRARSIRLLPEGPERSYLRIYRFVEKVSASPGWLKAACSPLPPQWERGLGVRIHRPANQRSSTRLNTRMSDLPLASPA